MKNFLWVIILVFGELSGRVVAATSGVIEGKIDIPSTLTSSYVVVYIDGELAGEHLNRPIRVEQRNQRFSKPFVVVPAGGSIEFSNNEEDDINHNVFSRSSNWNRDLGLFGPKQSRIRAFPSPGRVRIYCSIHRHMKMEVLVTPNSYFAIGKDYRYRIENVPIGNHTLKVWVQNRRLSALSQEIFIEQGKVVRQDIILHRRGLGRMGVALP